MKWTVTYRGKSGKTETKVFEAESRNALFSLLKSDGIIPIRVVEGTVKCDSSTPKWVLLLIGLVVIVAAACLMWFLFSCGSNNASSTDKAKRVIATEPTQRIKNTQYRVQYQKPAKTGDKLADALAEVEAAENALTINAAPKIKIPPGYTNRTFKTGVEQLMSWVFTTEVGDMPMPIPAISDEDRKQLAVILVSKNEIKDGDSERVIFAKESVDYAKEEMRKFITQGGDPDEFLQYYFSQLRHAFEFRNEAQQQYYDLQEEDPELAEDFAKKVNKRFDEKGIKRILTEKDEQETEEFVQ